MSVGRGTETPFEVIGAPWINGEALASYLNSISLPGVSFHAIRFTPDTSKFAGEACSGIRLTITDRGTFDPLRVGFEIARHLATTYADTWKSTRTCACLEMTRRWKLFGKGFRIPKSWPATKTSLSTFRKRRVQYLLYP